MVRRVQRPIIGLIVGVVAALAVVAPAQAYEPRVPESFFGVSATELWSLTESNRDAERNAQLDAMKAAGIDWARVEVGWPEIERNAPVGGEHSYTWGPADRLVAAFAGRGMELMALPMATPAWAGTDAESCGRRSEVEAGHVGDYVAFVEAFVARYGAHGSFWNAHPELPRVPVSRYEIWNEQNWSGFWCDEPNPERYAEMLAGAADAIHVLQPDAEVILGGLAAFRTSAAENGVVRAIAADRFLARAIAHEPRLAGSVDAVGFHPYDNDPAMNLSLISWFRDRMNGLGMSGAEIVLTEFGWRSGGLAGAVSELLRATNYTRMTGEIARTDCGIGAVAAHTWQSSELDPDNPNHWYGIASPVTGRLHPSGLAYRDQVALFEGRGPAPAPRATIRACGASELPDQDADGTPDSHDDFPLDPERQTGNPDERPPDGRAPPPAHEPRAEATFFGVNVVQLPADFMRLGAEYEAMHGAGIGIARQRIDWAQIEPVPPSDPAYPQRAQWFWLDRIMVNMARAGLSLRPSFGRAPAWATGTGFGGEYAAFLARFAERYGDGGSFWAENRNLDESRFAVRDYEIWQYGNRDADAPGGETSPDWYAATYLEARAALGAAAPGARALVSLGEVGQGGRAGAFLRTMVAARPELAGAIDGVMLMADYSRSVDLIEGAVRELRYALDDAGGSDAPIFLGFGAPTAGTGAITEDQRAQLFADVAGRAVRGDCGVAGVFPHAWTTPESNGESQWHWFGIADKDDATLSPTAEAYRDVSATYRGYGSAPAPTTGVHPCGAAEPPPATDTTGPALNVRVARKRASARAATVWVSASDPSGVDSIECRLNSRSWAPCAPRQRLRKLARGVHRLTVRATDELGNHAAKNESWRVARARKRR